MKKGKTPTEEFLNDTSEVHALWFGFYSAWFTLDRSKLSKELNEDIENDHHYFTAGHFIGRMIRKIVVLLLHKKIKMKNKRVLGDRAFT